MVDDSSGGMPSLMQYNIIRKFVPNCVIELNAHHVKTKGEQANEPSIESTTGVVCFFDLSGFSSFAYTAEMSTKNTLNNLDGRSSLSHTLSFGGEVLAKALNESLTDIIDVILFSGGDIIKFAGDALLVMWECIPQHIPSTVVVVTEVALFVTKLSNDKKNRKNVTQSFFLHSGIGCGKFLKCNIGGQVGEAPNRWEFFLAGDACLQSTIAEGCSNSGQVVVSSETVAVLKKCREDSLISGLVFSPLSKNLDPEDINFTKMSSCRILSEVIPNRRDHVFANLKDPFIDEKEIYRQLNTSLAEPFSLETMHSTMEYVPFPIRQVVESGGHDLLPEMRTISVLFIKLDDDAHFYPDCNLPLEQQMEQNQMFLKNVQSQVLKVQTAAYKFFATLRQFILDDKGFVCIIVLGLPPHYHQDNALRATKVAWEIICHHKIRSQVGICTGKVYCGSIGSRYRAEYSVTGDCINLAARLMHSASKNSMLLDEATLNEVNRTSFVVPVEELSPLRPKGQGLPVKVFRPILERFGHGSSFSSSKPSMVPRISSESFFTEAGHPITIGQEDAKKSIELLKFGHQDPHRIALKLLIIFADNGEGKSNLLEHAGEVLKPTSNVLYSSCDSSDTSTPFSIWRNILTQILKFDVPLVPEPPITDETENNSIPENSIGRSKSARHSLPKKSGFMNGILNLVSPTLLRSESTPSAKKNRLVESNRSSSIVVGPNGTIKGDDGAIVDDAFEGGWSMGELEEPDQENQRPPRMSSLPAALNPLDVGIEVGSSFFLQKLTTLRASKSSNSFESFAPVSMASPKQIIGGNRFSSPTISAAVEESIEERFLHMSGGDAEGSSLLENLRRQGRLKGKRLSVLEHVLPTMKFPGDEAADDTEAGRERTRTLSSPGDDKFVQKVSKKLQPFQRTRTKSRLRDRNASQEDIIDDMLREGRLSSTGQNEYRNEMVFELMFLLLDELSRSFPVTILLDNMHFADDDSWWLLAKFIERDLKLCEAVSESPSLFFSKQRVRFLVASRPSRMDFKLLKPNIRFFYNTCFSSLVFYPEDSAFHSRESISFPGVGHAKLVRFDKKNCVAFVSKYFSFGTTPELMEYIHKTARGNPNNILNLVNALVDHRYITRNTDNKLAEMKIGRVNVLQNAELLFCALPSYFVTEVVNRNDMLDKDTQLILKLVAVVGEFCPLDIITYLFKQEKTRQFMVPVDADPKPLPRTSSRWKSLSSKTSSCKRGGILVDEESVEMTDSNGFGASIDQCQVTNSIQRALDSKFIIRVFPTSREESDRFEFKDHRQRTVIYCSVLSDFKMRVHEGVIQYWEIRGLRKAPDQAMLQIAYHAIFSKKFIKAFSSFQYVMSVALMQGDQDTTEDIVFSCQEMLEPTNKEARAQFSSLASKLKEKPVADDENLISRDKQVQDEKVVMAYFEISLVMMRIQSNTLNIKFDSAMENCGMAMKIAENVNCHRSNNLPGKYAFSLAYFSTPLFSPFHPIHVSFEKNNLTIGMFKKAIFQYHTVAKQHRNRIIANQKKVRGLQKQVSTHVWFWHPSRYRFLPCCFVQSSSN